MKPESEEKQSIYPSTFLRVRVTFRHGAEGSRNQTPTALAWRSLRQQVRCPNLGAPLGKMSRMPGRFFIKHDSQAKTKKLFKNACIYFDALGNFRADRMGIEAVTNARLFVPRECSIPYSNNVCYTPSEDTKFDSCTGKTT